MIPKINYKKVKEELLIEHGAFCAYCQRPLFPNNTVIDCFLPKSLYPEKANDKDNLILCCVTCNIFKGRKLPYDENGNIVLLYPYSEEYQKLIRGSKNGQLVLNLDNATPAMLSTVKILALDKRPNVYINHGNAPVSEKSDNISIIPSYELNRITKVKICNFKSIPEIELSLDRINVLVGGNNAGKSSILQAVQFAIGVAQTANRYVSDTFAEKKLTFCADASAFMYSPTRDLNSLIRENALPNENKADFVFSTEDSKTDITLGHKINNSFEASISRTTFFDAIKSDTSPYCVYITGLSGLPLTEEFTAKAKVLKSATRGDSNLYLRNILWLLHEDEDKSKWESFTESFGSFYPDHTINISFCPETDETINVYAEVSKEGSPDIKIPLDMLGTGELQIIQIFSYISYFTPSILILDEPDTHLHPLNQKKLFDLLKEYSDSEGTQILIATHSRHILEKAQNAENTSVFWINHGKTAKKLDLSSNKELITVLQDIGETNLEELLSPDLECVIFTEDEKTAQTGYLKAILKSSGISPESAAIVPYFGCSKTDNIITAQKLIECFNPELKVIVHRDRDYLDDYEQEAFKSSFNKKGIKNKISVWFTKGCDLESVFVNHKHIKYCYPELDDEFISNAIKEAYEKAKDSSIKRMYNHQNEKEKPETPQYDAESIYDDDPQYYSYGKKTFGFLKSALQSKLRKNPDLIRPSEFIAQEELAELIYGKKRKK